jgi:carboxyl-terminal processing protease
MDSSRLSLFLMLFILSWMPPWMSIGECKPPDLTARDTRIKIEEILKAHATYHVLNEELIQRTLENYLEDLDPFKTYFLESEIVKWTNPSKELLTKTVENYKRESFPTFEEIHEAMVQAIERRNSLEKRVKQTPSPTISVKSSEFKDIGWAKNEEELLDRLLKIKVLQNETGEKLEGGIKVLFFQRIDKRRRNREEEIVSTSPAERKKVVYSHILKAMSAALDSQTTYFTPIEANQFMMQVQQRLFGIGAQLRDDLNGFSIVRILDNSPASQDNKIKLNDRIIAVDNEPVVGMDITEAVELIRGPQGTAVTLTILRKTGETEEKLDVKLTRGEVVLKESRLETSYEPFGNGIIGILKLFSFYQDPKYSSSADLREVIQKFKAEHNLKGVILDLRNNAGGLLPQAVSVSGLFITKGVVVSIKDNTDLIQRLRNTESQTAWDGPLIILTNRTSASAAEIVAQTLQEYGRAIVVGDNTTYGKGTFQTFTLESSNYGKVNPKGEYKVTRGRYYTVSGKSPQLMGVPADIVVPGIFSQMEIGEKFSKYPLDTDKINSSFDDDLSDIPSIHRAQVSRLYKFNLQPVVTTYNPYLHRLKDNSLARQNQNRNYSNFLKKVSNKDFSSESKEFFGETDLQLAETVNIMKDLLSLET